MEKITGYKVYKHCIDWQKGIFQDKTMPSSKRSVMELCLAEDISKINSMI